MSRINLSLFIFAVVNLSVCHLPADDQHPETQIQLEKCLEEAGDNSAEIADALQRVPKEQLIGMQFLVKNMPTKDLQTLSAEFLLDHVRLAYQARSEASWGPALPETVFFNDVLPYANVNESRDNVRSKLREQFWPAVSNLDSISEAAATLNQKVFSELQVKYSRQRRRADQGPEETMQNKTASCTGLSILLIDACRACGIPARFVGTPLWSDRSGNHSWVEIWDNGWHFTGAAEPTGNKLDQAWFVGRAQKAQRDHPLHAIYAVSFQKTDTRFPMVWARDDSLQVWAVNVTDRYARPQKKSVAGIEVMLRAFDSSNNNRCRANLAIRDAQGDVVFRGKTNDESHDANDHLVVRLPAGEYSIEWTSDADRASPPNRGKSHQQVLTVAPEDEGRVINLRRTEGEDSPSAVKDTPIDQLKAWLDTAPSTLEAVFQQPFAIMSLTSAEATEAKDLLVAFYHQTLREARKAEHEAKVIQLDGLKMPFEFVKFGTPPKEGHSLYISMHGGGNAPAGVNDRQWKNQQRLYQLDEGIYVAPRAPTNTWNLWHQAHIDPLFTRLIENFIAFEGINPDRVYLTGYSAGGDGVFQLAPRMADQYAAAAMMAGHPNETKPDGLFNLPFTLHMGAKDGAYNRNQKAEEWKALLTQLHQQYPGGYNHWVEIHEGKGHWMGGQDRSGVAWMANYTRSIIPEQIVWLQDDVLHERFYWLQVEPTIAKARSRIIARRSGNQITVEYSDVPEIAFLLRDDMCNLDEAIQISYRGEVVHSGKARRNIKDMALTLMDRGDPEAVFCARLGVQLYEDASNE